MCHPTPTGLKATSGSESDGSSVGSLLSPLVDVVASDVVGVCVVVVCVSDVSLAPPHDVMKTSKTRTGAKHFNNLKTN